jgi:tetratricopeptide (TPR) repeat protein
MPKPIRCARFASGPAALLLFLVTVAIPPAFAQNAPRGPESDLIKQAQEKIRAGDLEGALALDQQALAKTPDARAVHSQAGSILDLLGRYAEARPHFQKAIELASGPDEQARALRSMAVSYAFENDCAGATNYESQAYDVYLKAGDFYNAGEAANELARICIEAGELDAAAKWYQTGHDAGLKEPEIKPARVDLWNFRLEHAQARIAVRRGNKADADRHVAAARAILDKGTNPEQEPFFPYLTGYVAFYTGAYQTALTDLQKANQNDPFILALIGQTYEKLGNEAEATAMYRRALARATAHNPPTAYARPLAEKKLQGSKELRIEN